MMNRKIISILRIVRIRALFEKLLVYCGGRFWKMQIEFTGGVEKCREIFSSTWTKSSEIRG